MRDFPIAELISAISVDKISVSLTSIFNHLKKIRTASYPVARALRFIEAVSRDLSVQLVNIFTNFGLMTMEYEAFTKLATEVEALFGLWDSQMNAFRDLARERARRNKGEENLPIKIKNPHGPLQERFDSIAQFRRQHEEFRSVISKVFSREASYEYVSSNCHHHRLVVKIWVHWRSLTQRLPS